MGKGGNEEGEKVLNPSEIDIEETPPGDDADKNPNPPSPPGPGPGPGPGLGGPGGDHDFYSIAPQGYVGGNQKSDNSKNWAIAAGVVMGFLVGGPVGAIVGGLMAYSVTKNINVSAESVIGVGIATIVAGVFVGPFCLGIPLVAFAGAKYSEFRDKKSKIMQDALNNGYGIGKEPGIGKGKEREQDDYLKEMLQKAFPNDPYKRAMTYKGWTKSRPKNADNKGENELEGPAQKNGNGGELGGPENSKSSSMIAKFKQMFYSNSDKPSAIRVHKSYSEKQKSKINR